MFNLSFYAWVEVFFACKSYNYNNWPVIQKSNKHSEAQASMTLELSEDFSTDLWTDIWLERERKVSFFLPKLAFKVIFERWHAQ